MATMNRLLRRDDVVDYATYEDARSQTRPAALAAKNLRRIQLDEHLTFSFENAETLRYQVQEIMRVERIVREADIVHEVETYNAILGAPGELGGVLLIGVTNPERRQQLLRDWVGLQARVYVQLSDGTRVSAAFDPGQVGGDRLSAVQYLRFAVHGVAPVAMGTDFEGLESHVELTTEQITALTEDLHRT